MAVVGPAWGAVGLLTLFALISLSSRVGVLSRPDKETRDNSSGDGSIADIFDRVLENSEEFLDNDSPEGADQSSFNNTVAYHQAVLETVAMITHDKSKKNYTQEANLTKSVQIGDVFSLENEGFDDMTKLIDRKGNVFVMSNRKTKYSVLQVDLS